jgi:hypothetical protein
MPEVVMHLKEQWFPSGKFRLTGLKILFRQDKQNPQNANQGVAGLSFFFFVFGGLRAPHWF